MQLQGQSFVSSALLEEVSPMSWDDARYRPRKTGAFAGATLNDAGVCIDIEKMLTRSSPRVRQFLQDLPDEARRPQLDGLGDG